MLNREPLGGHEHQQPATILVVDDEKTLRDTLEYNLRREGYRVLLAAEGNEAVRVALQERPALIILDIMLPGMSGLDVCRAVRKALTVPILMLSAREEEIDKVLGLKIGADDYVTKPFSFMELAARVEAVLRRAAKNKELIDVLRFGDVVVDFKKNTATRNHAPLELSPREFRILKYFAEHLGEVVTRDQLLDHVWGYDSFPLTRTVDTHIAKLRQKIEANPGDPHYIVTVHRAGYKFVG